MTRIAAKVATAVTELFRFLGVRWQLAWRIVRPTRFCLLVIVAGALMLMVTAQGKELAIGFGDLSLIQQALFYLAVTWWAFQSWHWARVGLQFNFGLDRRAWDSLAADGPVKMGWLVCVLPRVYVAAVYGLAVFALVFADFSSLWPAALVMALLGVASIVFLIARTKIFGLMEPPKQTRFASFVRHPTRRVLSQQAPAPHAPREIGPKNEDDCSTKEMGRPLGFLDFTPLSLFALSFSIVVAVATWLWVWSDAVRAGQSLGAVTITFLAFSNIAPIGSFLAILAVYVRFPVIALCFAAAVLFSCWNDNHRIRPFAERDVPQAPPPRMTVADAAAAWLKVNPTPEASRPLPVVFVSTAGGGLRAAFWTVTVLGALQDCAPKFRERVFSISGVSGGSLGAVVFVAVGQEPTAPSSDCNVSPRRQGQIERAGQEIVRQDFLGPVFAALMYPDLTQRFLPLPWLEDRAAALERAWESAWRACAPHWGSNCAVNSLAGPFQGLRPQSGQRWRPALLLNGTVEETGQRIVTGHFDIDELGQRRSVQIWDFYTLAEHDVGAATAANNSARFTYVEPAGTIRNRNSNAVKAHILDGGYFENYGAETTLDVASVALPLMTKEARIRPVFIEIISDPAISNDDLIRGSLPQSEAGATAGSAAAKADKTDLKPVTFANEVRAPIGGLMMTREARGVLGAKRLAYWATIDLPELAIRDAKGLDKPVWAQFSLCQVEGQRDPALGWQLSQRGQTNIAGMLADASINECHKRNLDALKRVVEALN